MNGGGASVLVATKAAVIDLLKGRQDGDARLAGVRIDYAYHPRLAEKEYLWGGAARFARTMAGAAGPYDEQITLDLFVDVTALAAELEDADARAADIATAAAQILLTDPTMAGLPGLMSRTLASGDIEYEYLSYDDDSATTRLRLQLLLRVDARPGVT